MERAITTIPMLMTSLDRAEADGQGRGAPGRKLASCNICQVVSEPNRDRLSGDCAGDPQEGQEDG
jgi:hypothetical protein